jgi:hypothetical protein
MSVVCVGLVALTAFAQIYRPVDDSGLWKLVIVLLLVAAVAHVVFIARGQLPESVGALSKAYLCSGIGLSIVAAAIFVNGKFDSKPAEETSTTVARHVEPGRQSYEIEIEGVGERKRKRSLAVSRELYYALKKGDAIFVEVHPGALGLAWYGDVRPAK